MKRNSTLTITGLMGAAMNVYLAGEYAGFRKGFESAKEIYQDSAKFFISGDLAGYLIDWHIWLSLFFILFVIGIQIGKVAVSRAVCFASCLAALFIYTRWIVLMFENSELSFSDNLARSTHLFDYLSFLLFVGFLIYLTAATVRTWRDKSAGHIR